MTLKRVFFGCALTWFCLGQLMAQAPQAKKEKTFQIKSSYGTLEFEGTVVRSETQDSFEFTIEKMKFRFDPAAKTNKTKEIAMKEIAVVATKKPDGGQGPYKLLHRDKKTVSLLLTNDSPTGSLEKVKLTLPKEIAGKADHVGLNVTDGTIMWPIRVGESLKE